MFIKKTWTLYFLALLFFILACGESALYSKKDEQHIQQKIYLVPEYYNGNILLSQYSSTRIKTIEQNETVKFWPVFSINHQIIYNEHLQNYPFTFYWTFNEKKINTPTFVQNFQDSGSYDAILTTVDMYNDSLFDTVTVQVNIPVQITAQYPADHYNLLDPSDTNGISFFWKISGVDAWEVPKCYFYVSKNPKELWKHLIAEVSCYKPIRLTRFFKSDTILSFSDTSYSFYWGVQVITDSGTLPTQRDSTTIRTFSTKLQGSDSSIIQIPFSYKNLSPHIETQTRVDLLNAKDSVLKSIMSESSNDTIYFKNIEAQSNLKIKVTSLSLSEYQSDEIYFDIQKSVYLRLDEILLVDTISPEYYPLTKHIAIKDSIQFVLHDLGSGINPKSIHLFLGSDSLDYHFDEPILSFTLKDTFSCTTECPLKIKFEDYAKNKSNFNYWTLTVKTDSLHIKGPFPNEDLQ